VQAALPVAQGSRLAWQQWAPCRQALSQPEDAEPEAVLPDVLKAPKGPAERRQPAASA
jgi:hypothetical protein